jgi:hypothetical protein
MDDLPSVDIQRLPSDLPSFQFRPSHSRLDPFDDQAALQLAVTTRPYLCPP